ncbi:hypothetical protein [uncultured Roseobacter sp.]|uniref:hypothetical protein n=1 Tax=uncultured Roseobacter sp. TaxID=114847 RepID=UPI00263944E8|nr:hypothetical protein [uncultured Roseobacter sp.]
MSVETYHLTWQGIEIEVIYTPKKWNVTAHLELRSLHPKRAPLPITETGYKSHFHPIGTMEAAEGTITEQVTAWLDRSAQSEAWQKHIEDTRQLSLF